MHNTREQIHNLCDFWYTWNIRLVVTREAQGWWGWQPNKFYTMLYIVVITYPCAKLDAEGPLNIKMSSYQYRDPMLKIRRSHDHLIFNMGIPIPGKDGFYIESAPWFR